MNLQEALEGKIIPDGTRETLTILDIPYLSFNRTQEVGQLVVHKSVASEVKEIFIELFQKNFPIEKMLPVVFYDWDDSRSMDDNNTSAFNYRTIADTDRLSNHSYGLAIDINPKQNPYVKPNGVILPQGAVYDTSIPGTITPEIADVFRKRGWKWGGDWETPKDWQHFEKTLNIEPRV